MGVPHPQNLNFYTLQKCEKFNFLFFLLKFFNRVRNNLILSFPDVFHDFFVGFNRLSAIILAGLQL